LSGYREEERLIAAVYGLESPVSWENKPRMSDIFTLKGEAKALLGKISLDNPRYIPYSNSTALSERSISIEIKGENVGTIGSVSTGLLGRYDIDTEVHYFDLSLDAMRKVWNRMPAFRPYARFPVVRRDIAVIVDESVPVGGIEEIIRDAAGRILGDVTLFDVFRGDQAGAGKKSCAFSLEFVPTAGTLGQDVILGLMEAVTLKLKTSLGAELRQ
jgi:phenylalanyl-tRNA synthetase beta chain